MNINPLGTGAYNTFINDKFSTKNETSETADAVLAKYSSKNPYAAYGSNMYSGVGQSAMQRAIEELKQKNGGAVTFSMVNDYRTEMENDFKTLMLGGLALMGFEETEDFTLRATSEGEIEIQSNDPEVKAAVAFLLEESPKLKEQFLYIQALGNIERSKGAVSSHMQMQQAQADLAADAMDIMLNSGNFLNQASGLGLGYSSLMANFSQGNMQAMLGANYLV